jgi:aspartate racemase
MKTIGLIGGMSWESTLTYYRIINEQVRAARGALHSAQILLYSVNFAEIAVLQREGRWDTAAALLIDAAHRLERGGADCIILCTNTMHKVAEALQASISLPLLHIADATADAIQAQGIQRVGLLGTRFTMDEDFYRGRLTQRHNIAVLTPPPDEQDMIHHVIFDELCVGICNQESKATYQASIAGLVARGAKGIILGCTEIGLLINANDASVPLFDTTHIHATAAVAYALEEPHP